MKIIVGLGNPGEEYKLTRHNTGRIVLSEFLKAQKFGELVEDKKIKALKTEGGIGKEKILIVMPETYMNKSGNSLKILFEKIIKKKKVYPVGPVKKGSYGAENMIVVHDDIDLPLGKYKVSFGRGSAGHKGVESIIRAVQTKDFTRVRVGISPSTPKGKIKKPQGDRLLDFITGRFKPSEMVILKEMSKKITLELKSFCS